VRILQRRYARNSTTTRSNKYSSGTSSGRPSRFSTFDRDASVTVNHLVDDLAQASHLRPAGNRFLLICKQWPITGGVRRHPPTAVEQCCQPVQPVLILRLARPTVASGRRLPPSAHLHALRGVNPRWTGYGAGGGTPWAADARTYAVATLRPGRPVNALVTMVWCASVCASLSA
jgi:hypothetical protein